MSRHKLSIIIDVHDDLLAAHDGKVSPPPNDVEDWDFSDLATAVREGYVDEGECEIEFYDGEINEDGDPVA